MSMYLRLKRQRQTFFFHCEPDEVLGAVKTRFAKLVGRTAEEIQFHQYLTAAEYAQRVKEAIQTRMADELKKQAERLAREAEEEKNNRGRKKKKRAPNVDKLKDQIEHEAHAIPALDDARTVDQLGLQTDAIVFFVYPVPKTDKDAEDGPVVWEPIVVPGLREDAPPAEAAAGDDARASASSTVAQQQQQQAPEAMTDATAAAPGE